MKFQFDHRLLEQVINQNIMYLPPLLRQQSISQVLLDQISHIPHLKMCNIHVAREGWDKNIYINQYSHTFFTWCKLELYWDHVPIEKWYIDERENLGDELTNEKWWYLHE